MHNARALYVYDKIDRLRLSQKRQRALFGLVESQPRKYVGHTHESKIVHPFFGLFDDSVRVVADDHGQTFVYQKDAGKPFAVYFCNHRVLAVSLDKRRQQQRGFERSGNLGSQNLLMTLHHFAVA